MQTPAFVPLATRGAVKTLEPRDVAALGYEMVLGNTFHLFLAPGHELVAEMGGLHEFMRWDGPIITDSGGFQVFSMGYGGVADEIKGRRGQPVGRRDSNGTILAIEEEGVRFRSYLDGGERFMGPETSMTVQAALGSDIALVFDECTPFHVSRDYTARSMERTHRWLERCLDWHERHGPEGQVVYGIVQGGVEHDLRMVSAGAVADSRCDGIAIGGSLGQDKAQMHEVVDWTTAELERVAPDRPRHLLGIGEIDDLVVGVRQGIDTFDCAMPTRLGRHGVALVPDPERRWRVDLVKGRWRALARADPGGLPVPGVLGRVLPRLPALPAARPRAHRAAAGDPAQPQLHGAPDGRPARCDRGRPAGRGRRCAAGRRDPGRHGRAGLSRAPSRRATSCTC